MTIRQRLKESSERNRDISLLWGQVHDLSDQLTDARREREWWQGLAIAAQLDAEQLKDAIADLKERLPASEQTRQRRVDAPIRGLLRPDPPPPQDSPLVGRDRALVKGHPALSNGDSVGRDRHRAIVALGTGPQRATTTPPAASQA